MARADVILEALPLPPVPGLRHVISTRAGGVSPGPYAALNLGAHVGDDPACVAENRRRLAAAAGYAAETLVTAQQTHSINLAWVGARDRGRGALDWASAIPDTDGLLVHTPGTPVAVLVADCAPVLIAAPGPRALAVVHAGWRGAVDRIASHAARALLAETGCRPEDLLAGIGPTLCPDCLEIGHEVADTVTDRFGTAVLASGDKPHLRLRDLLIADLATIGVSAAHIVIHPACTQCETARFFSYRAQHGTAGRFALVAWWDAADA